MSSAAPPSTQAALAAAGPALKAAVLGEALPYLRRYAGQTVLVKYGGHAMSGLASDGHAKDGGGADDPFARDIVLLKQVGINPIVVHGGGPQIGQMLQRLGIKSRFVDGLRVTDRETMEVVEMVLAGTVNKQLVAAINQAGGCAVGLSGKDGGLIRARKVTRSRIEAGVRIDLDLGFVGEPEQVDDRVLATFRQSDIIPVIAPIGIGADGETYNINADTVAGAVAAAVKARRFLLLTDVDGVLDAEKRLITELTAGEARRLIADGTISGGMIPKVETCLAAVEGGVEAAVIVDGRVPHAILLELFTEGAGTLIRGG
jgi:acetylglutamate kinase